MLRNGSQESLTQTAPGAVVQGRSEVQENHGEKGAGRLECTQGLGQGAARPQRLGTASCVSNCQRPSWLHPMLLGLLIFQEKPEIGTFYVKSNFKTTLFNTHAQSRWTKQALYGPVGRQFTTSGWQSMRLGPGAQGSK